MHLQTVNIEDVYPDENNPRQNFEGIEELAASFDLNSERPGEPFTPPLLVQDGGIYRIIDGERRYRALKLRKAKRFSANVCESLDEANSIAAMLATDDKQPLSPLEKSRGVQQMLLLGVDPVQVEKAAKIKGAERIKRALSKVQDAGEDMSLDRLLAIEEFSDNSEMVDALTNCKESEYKLIIKDYKAKQLAEEVAKRVAAINSEYAGKENEETEVSMLVDLLKESEEKRKSFVALHLDDLSSIPHVVELTVNAFKELFKVSLGSFSRDFQVNLECEPCKLVVVGGYDMASYSLAMTGAAREILQGQAKFYSLYIAKNNEMINAFLSDGYIPDPWEKEVFEKIFATECEEV